MHALIMIFGAVMPGVDGTGKLDDSDADRGTGHGAARLNNFSFWILPFASRSCCRRCSCRRGARGRLDHVPAAGAADRASFPMLIFSIHLMGASSILGAINVIVTIVNMRAPGMMLLRMPLFVWTWLITAYLLIAVMPVLAGAVTMLLTDHFFGTTFSPPPAAAIR